MRLKIKTFSGKDILDKTFKDGGLTEFIEKTRKNPKTQKGFEIIVNKSSNESYRAQSQKTQNSLVHKNFMRQHNKF